MKYKTLSLLVAFILASILLTATLSLATASQLESSAPAPAATGQVNSKLQGTGNPFPPDCTIGGQSVTWTLEIYNDAGTDTGSLSGWSLAVHTDSCQKSPGPSMTFTKTVGTDPSVCSTTNSTTIPAGGGGTAVTYCYYMTNTGGVTVELHTVKDDRLGTVLGPDFPAPVSPGGIAWFTVTTLITQTTVNSATWRASDVDITFEVSGTDTATVTQGTPTNVSLSSFGSDEAALSPILLAGLFAIILGFGLVLRRRWIRVD